MYRRKIPIYSGRHRMHIHDPFCQPYWVEPYRPLDVRGLMIALGFLGGAIALCLGI